MRKTINAVKKTVRVAKIMVSKKFRSEPGTKRFEEKNPRPYADMRNHLSPHLVNKTR